VDIKKFWQDIEAANRGEKEHPLRQKKPPKPPPTDYQLDNRSLLQTVSGTYPPDPEQVALAEEIEQLRQDLKLEPKQGALDWSFDQIQRPMYGGIGAGIALAELEPKRAPGEFWKGFTLKEKKVGQDLQDTLSGLGAKHPHQYESVRGTPLGRMLLPPAKKPESGTPILDKIFAPKGTPEEQMANLKSRRGAEGAYAFTKDLATNLPAGGRNLFYETAGDPLTYVPAGAAGKALKPLKGVVKSEKAVKFGTKLAATKELGPAIQTAKAAWDRLGQVARLMKPFHGMTDDQVKSYRMYLWGKDSAKHALERELIKKGEELGLTREQAKMATHGMQYHELLEGDDPIKALEDALVKWKEQGAQMRQRAWNIEARLGIKTEKAQQALKQTTGEIAGLERRVNVATEARQKAAVARKELAALDKREELAGLDSQIQQLTAEMDGLTVDKKKIHRTALELRRQAMAAEEGAGSLYDTVKAQFKGQIRINKPKVFLKGAETDAWSKLPKSWKASKGGGIDIDELVELVSADMPGYKESHGGIVNSLDFVDELLESPSAKARRWPIFTPTPSGSYWTTPNRNCPG
jgi:hypothetical protein